MFLVRNELYSAVIGDVLDENGFRAQFLPREIRSLQDGQMLVGRAMPVLEADVFDLKTPYGLIFDALDSLKPGEIYLASGASQDYALWGELMTTTAVAVGAVGAVIDGCIRDTRRVKAFNNFPVFCSGFYGQDQKGRGRAIDYRVSIRVGQANIEPGDMIVGDDDGVLVVPHKVEVEIIEQALAKARAEGLIRKELEAGLPSATAFKKYGIM